MSSAIDVCEGCRRLRKRCDKDNCVLHPCLESLWPNSRQSQGNATVFLAKYFGRKRFFKLLEAVTSQQRAALFESLLQEACGRTVNPLGGATGLLRAGRWAECQMAVTTVLNGESPRPVPDAPSTPPGANSDEPGAVPAAAVYQNGEPVAGAVPTAAALYQNGDSVEVPPPSINQNGAINQNATQNGDPVEAPDSSVVQSDMPVEESEAAPS
ncbi:unnamed protein product [Calypogeia fissa]